MTWVGKPAPPRPTRPESLTALMRSSLDSTFGGLMPSQRRISPSDSIVTAFETEPLGILISPIAVTVPDTEAWMGALTNLSLSPMS